jgi:GNAT superfamily N-acetyltransferase
MPLAAGIGSVTYRQARRADMISCARVFVRSSRDLARRMGNTPPPTRPADVVPTLAHLQHTDPRGFHVAVKGERVVAFAATILRGNTHFLSMFWTLPGLQSQGVGRRVLARAFDGPRPPASAVRCVYASLDTRAQVLYLKFGMRPRGMF